MNRLTKFTATGLVALLAVPLCQAQMDVDQADSLNFQGFHKDKKEAVQVWREDKPEAEPNNYPVKVYEQDAAASITNASAPPSASAAPETTRPRSGKRYEIRERYTLSRSAATPYSAFLVVEALHRQMASLCPAGWRKLNERSEPVEGDFFLYYELECL